MLARIGPLRALTQYGEAGSVAVSAMPGRTQGVAADRRTCLSLGNRTPWEQWQLFLDRRRYLDQFPSTLEVDRHWGRGTESRSHGLSGQAPAQQ